jgi:crotonobetainyl-CoA:carnitine CoA-transferase CaiB-like acyl-CoA transferase
VNSLSRPEDPRVVEQANAHYGSVSTIAPHVALSVTGFDAQMRGTPMVGEHTREILEELGYPPADIEDLHQRRIVRSPAPRVKQR